MKTNILFGPYIA